MTNTNHFHQRRFHLGSGCGQHGRHGHHDMPEPPGSGPDRRDRHGRPERGRHGGAHGPHGRARRGEARYILLDVLRGGPKHGYEIIKTIEEKSGGQYSPSPGTVYPTMQYLGELGLVSTTVDGERRVFHITASGIEDLDEHAAEIAAFWERFAQPSGSRTVQREIEFLRQELDDLSRTVWGGRGSGTIGAGSSDIVRAVRMAIEKCKNDVRDIFARSAEQSETA